MSEGFFGFIFCFIQSFIYSPFEDINKFRQNKSTSDFVFLIFAFILFLILSGGKNSFRVSTSKIYSPMTTNFYGLYFKSFLFNILLYFWK